MAKMKSPNYPAISLREAVALVRLLWDKEKRTAVKADVAAKALGYKGLSGPVAARLSALKKYGLVESDAQGIRISQLGIKILHSPEGSDERKRATREAAFKPDLIRELAATHADASDAALTSHLLVDRHFSDAGARNFISAFRDTLELAGGIDGSYDDDKSERETMSDQRREGQGRAGDTWHGNESVQIEKVDGAGKPALRVFVWPLPNNTTAELRLTGGPITQEHLEMLRAYLDLAKAAVPKASEVGG